MILCLDIGNTQIHGGVFDGEALRCQFRKSTHPLGSSDELGIFFLTVLRENGVDPRAVTGVAVCSVVPAAQHSLRSAVVKYFHCEPFVLQAGAVISAALITGIRSDLPGQITAQVTENIYDSPTGRILLVPQGTRIIGQYDNNVQFGQRRVLLVWNRLIMPNGRSIVLERQPGADTQGYAGLEDGVDYHWWNLAKAAGLSTLLSVSAELAVDDDDRLLSAIRNGGQDTINDAGQQIIRRQLNVAPTLTIRPGFPVRVVVTRDLVLEPYRG